MSGGRKVGGCLGRRAYTMGDVVVIDEKDDVRNFSAGMRVGASPYEDGSAPRNGTTTVVAVDYDCGTIKIDGRDVIFPFADGDFLFARGGYRDE